MGKTTRVKKFVVDNLPILIVLSVSLLCGLFLLFGTKSENGSVTLDGQDAKIEEYTEKFIEDANAALYRIMNEDRPTDETVEAENDEPTGQGFYTTIEEVIGRRKPDGFNDNGKGLQAHKKGTMINLYDGGYKKVEDLKIGDVLVNDHGEKTRVVNVWESNHPLYKIITTQGEYYYTPEHPLGVNRNGEFSYIKTQDIVAGDRLVPVYETVEEKQTELTDEELSFLGFWLGDGYIDSSSEYTTKYMVVANDEKKSYIEGLLGDRITWGKHSNKKAWVGYLKVSNGVHENSNEKKTTALTEALAKCGRYSYGKYVGIRLSLAEREKVLEGYIRADGTEHHGGYVITTTSEQLALWVQESAWMLGHGSKMKKIREAGYETNLGVATHDTYSVSINKWFSQHDDGFEVISKELVADMAATVHIEVDGNHTYMAENIKVHNCSKYTAYLGTGKMEYSAAHPDYGPVNGKDMAAWLVKNYGYKYLDQPVEGAIGSGGFNTLYGHTAMYLYSTGAHTAMVNDANFVPLTVSTHNMNIDGWVWVVPGNYEPKPQPVPPTPEPEPTPEPTPTKGITYTYVKGDYFSKVLVELGLDEGRLWGEQGTVAYYTKQLIEQNMLDVTGNVKLGVPFTLVSR